MKTEAPDIHKAQLTELINAAYGLHVSSLSFLPRGEDAYAYLAHEPDGARHFLRAQAVARAGALEPAYAVAYALRARCGLAPAVAPYPTRRGTFTLVYGDYIVALFPFIPGATLYRQGASAADLDRAADILAAVHQSSDRVDTSSLPRENFDNPFRAPIMRALQLADDPPASPNPYRRRVLRLLAAQRADLLATFEKMERLQWRVQELASDWVLTHGDPNLDNFLKDNDGHLHLADWGELALGPPERDLFAFTGPRFERFLRRYARARPALQLHRERFAFYFYRWALQEVADYANRILFQDLGPSEDEHAWAELVPYLPLPHDDIAQGLQEVYSVVARVDQNAGDGVK